MAFKTFSKEKRAKGLSKKMFRGQKWIQFLFFSAAFSLVTSVRRRWRSESFWRLRTRKEKKRGDFFLSNPWTWWWWWYQRWVLSFVTGLRG